MKRVFDVEITKHVRVEIDDEVYNEDFLSEFGEVMWEVDDLEHLVGGIALSRVAERDRMEYVGCIDDYSENGVYATVDDDATDVEVEEV